MTTIKLRTLRWIPGLAALGLASGLLVIAAEAKAQSSTRVGGQAFGTFVNAAGVTVQSPVAALPDTGGMAEADTETFGVPNTLDSRWLMSITTGAVDRKVSSSQSSSEVENLTILGGVMTADIVTAITSSYVTASEAASNAAGSGFVGLVVNGVPFTDPAPNTRVEVPSVGYVVLNEQIRAGDGVTSSGITVNMIHLYLQSVTGGVLDPITGALLGGTLTTTGEIIVGSARSSVGF